jgi:hypothetical protein
MKVKCIKNNNWIFHLTVSEIYNIVDINDSYYKIIDDIGNERWYPKKWFKTLSEIRNEKIYKLLK